MQALIEENKKLASSIRTSLKRGHGDPGQDEEAVQSQEAKQPVQNRSPDAAHPSASPVQAIL